MNKERTDRMTPSTAEQAQVDKTTLRLFDTEASRQRVQKTIPILGIQRGGTTAVAGIVQKLGVHIGSDMNKVLEDLDFATPGRFNNGVVDMRNAEFDVWGWKYPNTYLYIDRVYHRLRNPRFVIVTRDLTANAISMSVRTQTFSTAHAVERAALQQHQHHAMALRYRKPVLFVSYEKLILNPEIAVREIANFLAIDPTEAQIGEATEFVKPGAYQDPDGEGLEVFGP